VKTAQASLQISLLQATLLKVTLRMLHCRKAVL
jgi:hypothetical protein